MLVADALDLQHRLPKTWARIESGRAKAWVGRKLAQTLRNETPETAAAADARVSKWVHKLSWGRLEKIALAAVAEADPAEARRREEAKQAETGVWLRPSNDHGVKDIWIRAAAPDAIWFDAAVDRVADSLALLGDTDPKDALRGKAVGVLARPQTALDRYAAAAVAASGAEAPEPAAPGIDTTPQAVLHVHLTDTALATGRGVARVEGEGPVTAETVREWLGHCRVAVKPVIDLNRMAPVDAYEVPDKMREAVHHLSPTDCFPFATNQSRRKDLDHTPATKPTARPNPDREPWPPHPLPPSPQNSRRLGRATTLARRVRLAITPPPPLPRRPHRHERARRSTGETGLEQPRGGVVHAAQLVVVDGDAARCRGRRPAPGPGA